MHDDASGHGMLMWGEKWLFAEVVTLFTCFLEVPEWNLGLNTQTAA
jgi:hypothetical protein